MLYLEAIFVFIIGSAIGSFLNVVIYRLPKGESLLRPGSHCPQCDTPIRWFDNIPLFALLWLKGRCRKCGAKISWRYPGIEALTGLLFLLVFERYLYSDATLVYWGLASVLVAITFIDFDHFIIPDRISIPGILAGFLLSLLVMFLWASKSQLLVKDPVEAAEGFAAGFGCLYFLRAIFTPIFKKEAMGLGDVKLMGMVGTLLGWKLTLLAIMLGSFVGVIGTLPLLLMRKVERLAHIPFGPSLATSTMICCLYGQSIIHWYVLNFLTFGNGQ